jgi:hypothetical protein
MRSARGVGGVHLRGDIGEVWLDGSKVGLVYRWELEGWQREFRLEAERYKLDPLPNGQRAVEVVLDLGIGELRASGLIWTDCTADGHSHRAIVIKGHAAALARK